MCGISGFVAADKIACFHLRDATDIIRYRGPDDEGFAFFQNTDQTPVIDNDTGFARVGLGHRRLSILDLSPLGHQPMSYADGRYWIVYNGEIYNYIELREELNSFGHHFLSGSDTEVILAAYAQWGEKCLSRLNGMWSFAIYDSQMDRVFLARDRFGVKPLYYWISPDGDFFFGSEIKQFTVLPGWKAVINPQRAYDFLVWGITDHTDETLFQGVHHLRPGHYALVQPGKVRVDSTGRIPVVQWYQIPDKHFKGSFEEASKEFCRLLKESVRLRLRSDVAVGSCLSGGLDSSSIVCLMDELLKSEGVTGKQKTFSALSKIEKFNEKKWIESVIEKTGAESHYTYPEIDKLFNLSQEILWHQDEPFGSTSIFAQWNVFELASQNDVRVMLDGQGADEQLFGYHSAMGIHLATLLKKGRALQTLKELKSIKALHGYSYKTLLAQTMSSLLPQSLQKTLRKMMGRTIPDPDWIHWPALNVTRKSPYENSQKSVKDYCHAQMTSTNLQMLLHWEDRDSMAHSIESRVPFLDFRLVEFSMSLPDDYKTKNGITKRVLRTGMDGVIPDIIRDRTDKIGFATPEEDWIRNIAPDLFRSKLKAAISSADGILNDNAMLVLEDIISGKRPFNFVIWRMISFGDWMQKFSVQRAT